MPLIILETALRINFFNVLIISATVLGLVFGFGVLFSKHLSQKAYKYLAIIVLSISFNNLYFWLVDTRIWIEMGWTSFRLFQFPWDLLLLPSFLFFVSEYLGQQMKNKRLFLIPFFIALLIDLTMLIWQWIDSSFLKDHLSSIRLSSRITEYFTIGFTIFLIVKVLLFIRSYDENAKVKLYNQRPVTTYWLKRLLYFTYGICIFWGVMLILDKIFPEIALNDRTKYYLIWLALSAIIYWLGYSGIYHLGLFNQRLNLRGGLSQTVTNFPLKNENIPNINRFFEIDEIIINEKLYLNSKLGLPVLAKRFDLSEGYISQLINKGFGDNFSVYINSLRIKKAKELLIDIEFQSYTILAIGLESGFNSKTSFYTTFKKVEGMSPSQYRLANKGSKFSES